MKAYEASIAKSLRGGGADASSGALSTASSRKAEFYFYRFLAAGSHHLQPPHAACGCHCDKSLIVAVLCCSALFSYPPPCPGALQSRIKV